MPWQRPVASLPGRRCSSAVPLRLRLRLRLLPPPLLPLLLPLLLLLLMPASCGSVAPPRIVFGTAWLREATASRAWAAFEAGFRAFDTANQPRHYDEPALGELVLRAAADGVHREQLWLQTKFTHPSGHHPPKRRQRQGGVAAAADLSSISSTAPYDTSAATEEQVSQSFRSSLEHLRTSYVDALFLHAPSVRGDRLAESDWRAWRAMETIALAGHAKALGVSNVNAAQLRLLLGVDNSSSSSRSGSSSGDDDDDDDDDDGGSRGGRVRVRPSLVQNRCQASRDKWDSEVRELCSQHGLIYQVRKRISFAPCYTTNDHFTKTGSGQT